MARKVSILLFSLLGLFVTAQAADVEITALGGVIPNDPTANVRIMSKGSGNGITLAAPSTTIDSLGQEQTAVKPVVKILLGQKLTLGSVYLSSGAADLTLGAGIGEGLLCGVDSALVVDVADSTSTLFVESVMTSGVQSVSKSGAGRMLLRGDFRAKIENAGSGRVAFAPGSGEPVLSVSGETAMYDIASSKDLAESFDLSFSGPTTTNGHVAVYEAADRVQLSGFYVVDGSTARLTGDGAFAHAEALSLLEKPLSGPAPDCVFVGTNSVGVLELLGSTLQAKTIVGAGDSTKAKGVLRLSDGATLTDVCSTEGEWLFGASGFAAVEVANSRLTVAGTWRGGRNGHLSMSIVDGAVFEHLSQTVRASGFSLGGVDGFASVYVAKGGVFRGLDLAGEINLPDSGGSKGVVFAVEDGQVDLGASSIRVNPNGCLTVGSNGLVRAGTIQKSGSATVQFDGGVFESTSGGTPFAGSVLVQRGGLGVSVPVGQTVTLDGTCPLIGASGKGVESISVWESLSNAVFLAAPAVQIAGGNGSGASAVCIWDAASGKVTGFHVTGRGAGYGSGTQVKVLHGDQVLASESAVTLSENVSGGLVKTGPGTLEIDGENSNYGGVTEVRGGRLLVLNTNAVLNSSGVRLSGGGVLDLNGQVATFPDFGGDGTGSVVNGSVVLSGLVLDAAKVASGVHDTLNLTNVTFAARAHLTLKNVAGLPTDPTKEYLAYEFVSEIPSDFPGVDVLSPVKSGEKKGWSLVFRDNKAYLRYLDGSLFIYY